MVYYHKNSRDIILGGVNKMIRKFEWHVVGRLRNGNRLVGGIYVASTPGEAHNRWVQQFLDLEPWDIVSIKIKQGQEIE